MMNNFRKNSLVLVIGIVIIVAGYSFSCKFKNNIEKNNYIINEESSRQVLAASNEDNIIKYNDMENDFKEIEYLENILNDEYFILINKDNKLSEGYMPDNLETCDMNFLEYVQDNQLESTTADAVKNMFDAASKDGIILVGVSGYRSYNVQKNLYDTRIEVKGEERTRAYTAEPGASEHQSGLAIDILCDGYEELDEGFENTEAFRWLMNNCYKYGFILRYTKGKEDITGYNYEPWHFRYIGNAEIAEDIMSRGITFEEYINEINTKLQELKK